MDGKKVKRGDRDIEKDTEKKEEQKLMGRGIRKNRIFWGALLALGLEAARKGALAAVLSLIVLRKGLTFSQLSAAFAVFSAASFLLEVPSGVLADCAGRKRVFITAQAVGLGALLLMLKGRSFWAVCTAFFLYGASGAFSSGSMDALYMDSCIADGTITVERGAMHLELAEISGCAGGALLGGVLNYAGGRHSAETASQLVLTGAVILTAAALFCALFFTAEAGANKASYKGHAEDEGVREKAKRKGENHLAAREETGENRRAFWELLSNGLPILLGSSLFAGFSLALMETYWQPMLAGLLPGAQDSWIPGVLGFFYYAASAAGSLAAGKYLKEETAVPAFALSGLMTGGVLLLLCRSETVLFFSMFYLLLYFLLGIFSMAQSSAVHRAVSPALRATALSGGGLAIQIGGFLASCFAGFTADKIGISGLWLIAGFIFLTGTGSAAALLWHMQKPHRDR